MLVNLRDFENFPAHLFLEGDPEKLTPDFESLRRVVTAAASLEIQKSAEEFFCQAEIEATVRLECARCLGEFETKLRNKIDFIVCSENLYVERSKEGFDSEDYVFFQGPQMQADVTPMVRQAIILAIGMKPLCAEDCRGLCPRCGVNRNERTCTCETGDSDPRWESLKNLLKDS